MSAVVLAWRSEPWLRRCVNAVLASEKVDVDVVLVDNGCTDDDVEVLERLDRVTVVRPGRNLGFSAGCNAGVAASTGEFVALINGDAIVEPGTIARLVEELERPDVGIAAAAVRLADSPSLLNSSGNMVHVLGLSWVGGLGEPETRTEPTDVAGAMGAGFVTTRAHWDRLGGFFEHFFAYHEDADLSIRTWRMTPGIHLDVSRLFRVSGGGVGDGSARSLVRVGDASSGTAGTVRCRLAVPAIGGLIEKGQPGRS